VQEKEEKEGQATHNSERELKHCCHGRQPRRPLSQQQQKKNPCQPPNPTRPF
jgi:hypothetical protein